MSKPKLSNISVRVQITLPPRILKLVDDLANRADANRSEYIRRLIHAAASSTVPTRLDSR
jgi:metal-responsive CopG/Arc/MetJ family transcriptional regulator